MDAETIRARREELDWTQVDLAVASRLSPSTIHRAERGERVTRANLAAIERAFMDAISSGGPSSAKKRAAATSTGG